MSKSTQLQWLLFLEMERPIEVALDGLSLINFNL